MGSRDGKRTASTALLPVLMWTTDLRRDDTSVAVMMADGRMRMATSLSFSTLASDRPWQIGAYG